MLELSQLFIHITNHDKYSLKYYNNKSIHHNLTLRDLPLQDIGYSVQKALITLPIDSDIDYKIHDLKKLASNFKNAFQVVMYQKENYKHYFIDIYFVERDLVHDYTYASCDMAYYKSSGKRMKDISKYNEENDNHVYVQAGERIPTISNGEVKYIKTKKWSKLLVTSKKHFIRKNNTRKECIVRYLNNKISRTTNKIRLATANQWRECKLEFMYVIKKQIMNANKGKTEKQLYYQTDNAMHRARIRNKEKVQHKDIRMKFI